MFKLNYKWLISFFFPRMVEHKWACLERGEGRLMGVIYPADSFQCMYSLLVLCWLLLNLFSIFWFCVMLMNNSIHQVWGKNTFEWQKWIQSIYTYSTVNNQIKIRPKNSVVTLNCLICFLIRLYYQYIN